MALKKFKLHSKSKSDKPKNSWKTKARSKKRSTEREYRDYEREVLSNIY